MTDQLDQGGKKNSLGLLAFALFAGLCAVLFTGLGIWQVERLGWKNELIAAVETRAHAAPLDLNTADWSAIDPETIQYQRVSVNGTLLTPTILTQAVTAEGPGFWAMTPLRLLDGRTVLVNRGFAPKDTDVSLEAETPATITGLLRVTEPEGGFLRTNDPAANRWFSRDVAAIGATLGLENVAPFFIDADRAGDDYPRGGLTVISFSNNHLIYALTWFGLALLCLFALGYLVRERLLRRP
ncbi:hypothetical protein VW35_18595 [Devosia soli]|uniref:SURF1-like protein n=1 Tax=Devosia soli TaxID=361041 RepID=A0A0F5L0R9_9HYPH|nr:SURF1 family protein [Devosia soli]KKB75789.1 hypothetical protein VW35_18595 [Devosia soli]